MSEAPETPPAVADPPAAIRERSLALAEYLLAVRSLLEKPVRAVPTADAYWQDDLPAHPRCELGPREPGGSWLRVGRPEPPAPPSIPTPLLRHLVWDLSADSTPTLATDAVDGAPEEVRAAYLRWHEEQWLPWSREHRAAAATRDLHDRLYDLRYRVDIDAARVELVWGHTAARHAGDPLSAAGDAGRDRVRPGDHHGHRDAAGRGPAAGRRARRAGQPAGG